MITIKNERARKILSISIPFALIPASVVLTAVLFHEKHYAAVSLFVTLLVLILFISGIEKKKTGTRRLVITAVMTSLSVVGRFIPIFKPVTAMTIISGIYICPESGFTVGALTALLSDFYFGQGPWTPFQMMAWGLIGYIAGLLSSQLQKSRASLLCFGALSGVLYSAVMDVWTVLWYSGDFSLSLYIAAEVTALPYTVSYAVSNVFFLFVLARPFGEKLGRLRIKYGI
ncbi:MAG: ECF transporter S component [Firmicutes bacterium]|nr:ECF transporter S component [Bacillota bacterium]MCD7831367.1 ECF transporter S component [Bacillota bacterium]